MTGLQKNVLTLGLLGAGAYFLYTKYKDKFNPASDQNLAYQGVNKLLSAGGIQDSVGGWLYNLLHPDQYDGMTYSTAEHRYTQIQRRSDGAVFNVDASGVMTPA